MSAAPLYGAARSILSLKSAQQNFRIWHNSTSYFGDFITCHNGYIYINKHIFYCHFRYIVYRTKFIGDINPSRPTFLGSLYYNRKKWDKMGFCGNHSGSVPCVNHDHIFLKF